VRVSVFDGDGAERTDEVIDACQRNSLRPGGAAHCRGSADECDCQLGRAVTADFTSRRAQDAAATLTQTRPVTRLASIESPLIEILHGARSGGAREEACASPRLWLGALFSTAAAATVTPKGERMRDLTASTRGQKRNFGPSRTNSRNARACSLARFHY
jgi:hypothetical protein